MDPFTLLGGCATQAPQPRPRDFEKPFRETGEQVSLLWSYIAIPPSRAAPDLLIIRSCVRGVRGGSRGDALSGCGQWKADRPSETLLLSGRETTLMADSAAVYEQEQACRCAIPQASGFSRSNVWP